MVFEHVRQLDGCLEPWKKLTVFPHIFTLRSASLSIPYYAFLFICFKIDYITVPSFFQLSRHTLTNCKADGQALFDCSIDLLVALSPYDFY